MAGSYPQPSLSSIITLRVEDVWEKGLKKSWGWKILVFADMSKRCVILSKLLVHRFAEMYNEYKNIV